jgi:hypothetical protein
LNSDELRKLRDKGPYMNIMSGNFAMYDNVMYQRDINICGPETLVLQSGNIIKYYRCNQIETFQIVNDKVIS